MPRKKLLACKLTSAHVCNVPGVVPSIKLTLDFFGPGFDFTNYVKRCCTPLNSEAKDFLAGKKVLVDDARLVLCLSKAYVNSLKGEFQNFLDSLFEPLVDGCVVPVDDWGSAAVSVVAGSWSIVNLTKRDDNDTRSQLPYCMVTVGFKAWVQIDKPLIPRSLQFFSDGFYLKNDSTTPLLNRRKYEIFLAVLENRDQLYINREASFYMVAPQNKKEFKRVFVREIEKKIFSIYDFAKLAAFVVNEADLRNDLLICKDSEAFRPTPPAVGPVSAGMFGGQLRKSYPYAPRVWADFPTGCRSYALFTKVLPELCDQLKIAPEKCRETFKNCEKGLLDGKSDRYCCEVLGLRVVLEMYTHVADNRVYEDAFETFDQVAKNVTCFSEALMKFHQKYLGGRSSVVESGAMCYADVLEEVIELAWNKVEMDPVTYFDDENPVVAKMASAVLENKFKE